MKLRRVKGGEVKKENKISNKKDNDATDMEE